MFHGCFIETVIRGQMQSNIHYMVRSVCLCVHFFVWLPLQYELPPTKPEGSKAVKGIAFSIGVSDTFCCP